MRVSSTALVWAAAWVLPSMLLWAQTPTGSIAGVVHDASGAVVPNASIAMTGQDTGLLRNLLSASDGSYIATALPPGVYQVKVAMSGFRTVVRDATVETGATTTVDLRLELGQTEEVINVEAASAQIEYNSNTISGVITREKIQDLPLNGRSFLNLAFLEPGVSVSPGTTSQYNSLFTVSVLGGDSSKTAITVDGGNIRNPIEGNTAMNLSQDVIQEFQISSVNFDLSTGITSVGSVNVVTRSGGNSLHGSAYFFYRDHNMSAYPGLARSALSPNPFFARRNPGAWIGGPIKKDRFFFFFNYENLNQTQVVTFVPNVASGAGLAGNYFSPYHGKNITVRFDYSITANHHLFARYTHDGNAGLGPAGSSLQLPSHWLRNTNWSDQSLLGLTSTLKPTLVNDFRFSYQYWQNRNLFPTSTDCPGCLGLGFPEVAVNGTNITVGDTSNATQGRDLRKYNFTDSLTWQKGRHSLHFGGEFEHAPGTGFWGYCDPACTVVAPPELVRANVPASLVAALFPTLPTTISSNADLLNLPFLGGVVGIGDPSQPPPYHVDQAKENNRYRVYASDSWRIRPDFTLNYGLAWSFESTLVNRDLNKPAFLAPLYGSDLSPTNNNYHNFEPALGFAWTVDKAQKTVVRGGFGIYYDTESLYRRLQERSFIGPVGNGRIQFPTTGFTNIFPGIVNISLGGVPVPVGAPLPSGQLINLTLGQYLQIQQQQAPIIAAQLAPTNLNNVSVTNIDINKAGAQLYPKNFPVQHGLHFDLGVQRQIGKDIVVDVDFVRRVYLNVNLGEIDYNRYNRFINGVRTPVIPVCPAAQKNTPGVECSNGSITFWTPGGRNVYDAMLVKVNKRFAKRFQFTASYALTDQHGYNGIVNLDRWNESWGPQGPRNVLNVSGVVDLPLGFQLGLISESSTRGPIMPFVNGVSLTGDGSTSAPLPGLAFNCLNRGCGTADLQRAVANWNQNYAGTKDALGKTIPAIVLPANYSLGDSFNSQDVRLTKTFRYHERYRLQVFAEAFNIFNIANLSGYSFNLDQVTPTNQTYSFGQPTSRAGQVFGSGGPRAFQLGARVQF
ncbi:MAG TPA: carboxypeptidase-like regulatory domain-containing protein [Bryobacteraceae bacterium]|nr:carboxypeptidase-like regulatory domain-containing protein [Bryobacteraceae bacterium]